MTSDRAGVDIRRRDSRRVIVVSLATSIAIHAFVFSLGIGSSAATSPRAGAAPDFAGSRTSRGAPSGIRITRIVVGEPAVQSESQTAIQLELPETAAGAVAELIEPESEDMQASAPDDPPPAPDPAPGDLSPTHQPGVPGVAGNRPAARLRPRFTNPALWRRIQNVADPAVNSGVRVRDRVDDGASRYVPSDAWAFNTWTRRDATGRLWGAAPGVIYLSGFSISTCGGRFDASNCGFGVPGWRRREYQRFLQAVTEIEEQQRWGRIMERGRAITERRGAERHPKTDSIPEMLDGD